jgi:hypothetical protein
MQRTIKAKDEQTFTAFVKELSSWKDEDVDEIEIRFNWDIPEMIQSSFGNVADDTSEDWWHPATHVVLLRDSASETDFMATTCEEYITTNWDSFWSPILLEFLNGYTAVFLAAVKERATLAERVLDLTKRAAASEKAVAEAETAADEKAANAERAHAEKARLQAAFERRWDVRPREARERPRAVPEINWRAMFLPMLQRAAAAAQGVAIRHGDQRAILEEAASAESAAVAIREVYYNRLVSAKEAALVEKAKLEEAVAKLRAAVGEFLMSFLKLIAFISTNVELSFQV